LGKNPVSANEREIDSSPKAAVVGSDPALHYPRLPADNPWTGDNLIEPLEGGWFAAERNVKPTRASGGAKPAQAKNPGGISQYGNAQGNKSMNMPASKYRGDRVDLAAKPISEPMGNTLTHGTGPKGQVRTVSRCGSQQDVSPATPIGPTKDTLAEYGPDYQNSRTRG
jgi:hypothetical protein